MFWLYFRKNDFDINLNVQLEAVKLLEMAFLLPTSKLPQFQMYKWAFINSQKKCEPTMSYQPHVQRIYKKMELAFGDLHVRLFLDLPFNTIYLLQNNYENEGILMTCQEITSIYDLYKFFKFYSDFTFENVVDYGDAMEKLLEKDIIENKEIWKNYLLIKISA